MTGVSRRSSLPYAAATSPHNATLDDIWRWTWLLIFVSVISLIVLYNETAHRTSRGLSTAFERTIRRESPTDATVRANSFRSHAPRESKGPALTESQQRQYNYLKLLPRTPPLHLRTESKERRSEQSDEKKANSKSQRETRPQLVKRKVVRQKNTKQRVVSPPKATTAPLDPRAQKYFFAIMVHVRDEEEMILEFVTHYLEEGVDHIFIYDDHSVDNTLKWLRGCIDRKYYTIFTSQQVETKSYDQRYIYSRMYQKIRPLTEWLLVADVDELITSRSSPGKTIREFLKEELIECAIISVPWLIFSWDNHSTTPMHHVRQSLNYRWGYESNYSRTRHYFDRVFQANQDLKKFKPTIKKLQRKVKRAAASHPRFKFANRSEVSIHRPKKKPFRPGASSRNPSRFVNMTNNVKGSILYAQRLFNITAQRPNRLKRIDTINKKIATMRKQQPVLQRNATQSKLKAKEVFSHVLSKAAARSKSTHLRDQVARQKITADTIKKSILYHQQKNQLLAKNSESFPTTSSSSSTSSSSNRGASNLFTSRSSTPSAVRPSPEASSGSINSFPTQRTSSSNSMKSSGVSSTMRQNQQLQNAMNLRSSLQAQHQHAQQSLASARRPISRPQAPPTAVMNSANVMRPSQTSNTPAVQSPVRPGLRVSSGGVQSGTNSAMGSTSSSTRSRSSSGGTLGISSSSSRSGFSNRIGTSAMGSTTSSSSRSSSSGTGGVSSSSRGSKSTMPYQHSKPMDHAISSKRSALYSNLRQTRTLMEDDQHLRRRRLMSVKFRDRHTAVENKVIFRTAAVSTFDAVHHAKIFKPYRYRSDSTNEKNNGTIMNVTINNTMSTNTTFDNDNTTAMLEHYRRRLQPHGLICIPNTKQHLACTDDINRLVQNGSTTEQAEAVIAEGDPSALGMCPGSTRFYDWTSQPRTTIRERDINDFQLVAHHYRIKSDVDWQRKSKSTGGRSFAKDYIDSGKTHANRLDIYDDFMTLIRQQAMIQRGTDRWKEAQRMFTQCPFISTKLKETMLDNTTADTNITLPYSDNATESIDLLTEFSESVLNETTSSNETIAEYGDDEIEGVDSFDISEYNQDDDDNLEKVEMLLNEVEEDIEHEQQDPNDLLLEGDVAAEEVDGTSNDIDNYDPRVESENGLTEGYELQ